jgi:hypothetical protein
MPVLPHLPPTKIKGTTHVYSSPGKEHQECIWSMCRLQQALEPAIYASINNDPSGGPCGDKVS